MIHSFIHSDDDARACTHTYINIHHMGLSTTRLRTRDHTRAIDESRPGIDHPRREITMREG